MNQDHPRRFPAVVGIREMLPLFYNAQITGIECYRIAVNVKQYLSRYQVIILVGSFRPGFRVTGTAGDDDFSNGGTSLLPGRVIAYLQTIKIEWDDLRLSDNHGCPLPKS